MTPKVHDTKLWSVHELQIYFFVICARPSPVWPRTMVPVDVLLSFCMFWTGLHALKYFLPRFYSAHSARQLTKSRAILPLDRTPSSSTWSLTHYIGYKISRALLRLELDVSLSTVNLRIETTALNVAFDKASAQLAHASPYSYATQTKRLLQKFYSAGAVVGLVGMGTGYSLLLWSCVTVFYGLDTTTNTQNTTHYAQTDEPLSSSDGTNMGGTGLAVQPIIPGVTVPLHHLPVLLVALLMSQVVHEAGHAVAAIPESVPVLSVGLGLMICLPSAFVSLGSAAFDKLAPFSRMRIATAGAHHNLILWLVIATLGWSGIGRVFSQGWTGWGTPFGLYKNIDDMGVAIHSIESDSDLSNYLYSGDIITRIEDTILAQAPMLSQRRTPLQLWHDLLLHHHHNVTIEDLPDMGWCVDKKWYEAQPSECCTNPGTSSLVCFSPTNTTSTGSCLDPFKVFHPSESPMALVHGRCANACITADAAIAEDEPDQVCVRAKSVTRIGVVRNNEPERTVLWSGPSEEIWEQVQVDNIAPRYWLVPQGLPEKFALLISYTSTITLSLFFLNLLPIRHLDGAQVLSALLDMYTPNNPPHPLSPFLFQTSVEEGNSEREHSFAYEAPERRPRILRRHTSSSTRPSRSTSHSNIYEFEQAGWVARHRKHIEGAAEGVAVGLVILVAIGNASVFVK